MNSANETYSCRGGENLPLTKNPNKFVVRATPKKLAEVGITDTDKVSPSSSRVTTSRTNWTRWSSDHHDARNPFSNT